MEKTVILTSIAVASFLFGFAIGLSNKEKEREFVPCNVTLEESNRVTLYCQNTVPPWTYYCSKEKP